MSTSQLDERYNRIAAKWQAKLEYLWFDRAYEALARALPVTDGARVLDVGCGTGCLSAGFLRAHGTAHPLTLLDPASEMLTHAEERLGRMGCEVTAIEGVLGASIGAPFDLVLCAHVIEHLPDPLAGLRQLRGALRPGGVMALVVSKPHWCSSLVWMRWRHRTFRTSVVLELLETAGFHAAQLHPMGAGPPGRVSMGYIVQG